MRYKKYEMKEHIRETLEYAEARRLLLQRAAIRAEIKRINAELRKLQYLSPDAVRVAKTDAEESTPGMPDKSTGSSDT